MKPIENVRNVIFNMLKTYVVRVTFWYEVYWKYTQRCFLVAFLLWNVLKIYATVYLICNIDITLAV